jgi:uncharacterized protein
VTTEAAPSRTPPLLPNGLANFENSVAGGKLTWVAPLFFLPARSALLIIGQSVFALGYHSLHHVSLWAAAGSWWTVWGTVADLGCIAILCLLARREGLRIRDLAGRRPPRLLLTGLGYFFLVFPFSVLGTLLASWIVYGSWQAPMPAGEVIARHLPLWGILYSLIVWAPIWSAVEELTYNGYLAPRVAFLSGRRWVPLILVGFWWAVQHSFLPLVLDWRFAVWRFLAFVPGVFALIALYFRTQKLQPLIVAHCIMDLIAAATTLAF